MIKGKFLDMIANKTADTIIDPAFKSFKLWENIIISFANKIMMYTVYRVNKMITVFISDLLTFLLRTLNETPVLNLEYFCKL